MATGFTCYRSANRLSCSHRISCQQIGCPVVTGSAVSKQLIGVNCGQEQARYHLLRSSSQLWLLLKPRKYVCFVILEACGSRTVRVGTIGAYSPLSLPKEPPGAVKSPLRLPKEPLRSPEESPSHPSVSLRRSKESPRSPQGAIRSSQGALRSPKELPRSPPRSSNEVGRSPQELLRNPKEP